MKPVDQSSIRTGNLMRMWDVLVARGEVSRQTLADALGLSVMTVGNLVEQMNATGVLNVRTVPRQRRPGGVPTGRKAEVVSISRSRHALLMVNLSGRRIFRRRLLAMDASFLTEEKLYVSQEGLTYEENLRWFLLETRERAPDEAEGREIAGVAVVTPGPYIEALDTVQSRRVPDVSGLRIKALLLETLGIRECLVEEDVKLALRAYAPVGDYTGARLIYYLHIGEGVSGAVSHVGEVVLGRNAAVGDAGQMIGTAGIPFEDLVSLRHFAHRLNIPESAVLRRDMLRARMSAVAGAEPERYRRTLKMLVPPITEMLYNIVCMLDPDLVLVDIRYAAPFEGMLLSALDESLRAMMARSPLSPPRLMPAELGVHALTQGLTRALVVAWMRALTQ